MDRRRFRLHAAAILALGLIAGPASADISEHAVFRDAQGFAFVMVSTRGAERRFIPLAEYLRLQSVGQAPDVVVNVVEDRRQIAPSVLGAQWNVGVFR